MLSANVYACTGSKSHQRHGYGVHRPELGLVRRSLTACCRHCGRDIRRAHGRSTWWRLDDVKNAAPETFPRDTDPGEGAE